MLVTVIMQVLTQTAVDLRSLYGLLYAVHSLIEFQDSKQTKNRNNCLSPHLKRGFRCNNSTLLKFVEHNFFCFIIFSPEHLFTCLQIKHSFCIFHCYLPKALPRLLKASIYRSRFVSMLQHQSVLRLAALTGFSRLPSQSVFILTETIIKSYCLKITHIMLYFFLSSEYTVYLFLP